MVKQNEASIIERFAPRVAWGLVVVTIVGETYLLLNGLPGADPMTLSQWISTFFFATIPVSFVVTSAVIVSRQPRNMVGWTLAMPALSFVAASVIQGYFSSIAPPTSLGWWQLALLSFENFSWVLLIFPLFHLMLIFPNGRIPSKRWRLVVALEIVMVATMVFLSLFAVEIGPQEGDVLWTVANPIGFIPIDAFDRPGVDLAWSVGLITLTVAGVVALVTRFRHADKTERQQIKWMLVAVVFFGLVYPAAITLSGETDGGIADIFLALSINALAVAIAFGVLKYRLYDIDRFVSRTVGYTLVIGVLSTVYIAGAVWLPSQLAGNSPIFVAGSTLAVAALFNPLRRWVQKGVDRRFYRAKYDLDRVAEDFALRLRNPSEAAELTDDWMKVVSEALQPSASGVWVRF